MKGSFQIVLDHVCINLANLDFVMGIPVECVVFAAVNQTLIFFWWDKNYV